jgi:hypothetical protein
METEGADALFKSVQADKLVTLPAITSLAKTLGAKVCICNLPRGSCSHIGGCGQTVAKTVFERAQADKQRIRCQTISDKQCIETLQAFIGELWCCVGILLHLWLA